jgi:predicted ATPase/class 3 adenylate cyclase
MSELPTGTVTFLFTDLEVSTRLWEEHSEAMHDALARHDEILRDAIGTHRGHVVKTTGDGFHAVFSTGADAVAAACRAQVELQAAAWGSTGPLRVRMGLHTCEAEVRDGDYYGSGVNRAARLMAIAHGGQVVLSSATAEVVVESGFELVDLGEQRLAGLSRAERVWQLCSPRLARDFPALRSLEVLPGNMPRQLTSFVGRDKEVEEVAALVRSHPLVTLTGVGGVGKTRLALEVAAAVISEFADGAWWCELAPLRDPDALWATVASTFRVLPMPGRSLEESVLELLGSKRLLLVLDNCEHLLDAVANLVVAVEARCPGVSVLATSREGLAVTGEEIVAVGSLGVPAENAEREVIAAAEAVRLFCDRAHSARKDFALTDRNAVSIGVLCRRLDGIPLAMELAAARVTALTPEDIVDRLDQRFKLLTHGGRASLERHQTLQSTIDWSYELLGDRERQALNRLSVFAGGCDLDAAETVVGGDDLDPLAVVDVLGQLVDKSLVVADPDDDGRLRYQLLETIRQYAQEQLEASGDASTIRRRHADYCVQLAEAAGPRLRSRDQLEWAGRMARETDNFRATLGWAVETASPDHALRVVAALAVYGVRIGYSALDWAESAVTIPGAQHHALFTDVASAATWSATLRLDFDMAAALVAQIDAVEAAQGSRKASACQGPAGYALLSGDLDAALARAETWVGLARATGDPYEIANALPNLAGVQNLLGDVPGSLASIEETIRLARQAGIPSLLSLGLTLLAVWLPIEDAERALALCDEAIAIGTALGDGIAVGTALATKGWILAYQGDTPAAFALAADAARHLLAVGFVTVLGAACGLAAVNLSDLDHPVKGAVLFGAAQHLMTIDAPDWARQLLADTEAALIETLGRTSFDERVAQGTTLTAAEATNYLAECANASSKPDAVA